MFRFIKKCFFIGLTILSSFTSSLNCISMNNQACKARTKIINVNRNNLYFIFLVLKQVNLSNDNCNNVNNPYALSICVPDVVKDLNVKVFNLMSRTNETRHVKWHETCKCIL